MKKCPFCAEEVQDDAVKCRFCNEMLEKKDPVKWYLRISTLITAFLVMPPLVIPLVWINSRFSLKVKVIISVIMVVITYWLCVVLAYSLTVLNEYYKMMF